MKFVCSNEPRSTGFLMGRGQDSVRRTRSGADWLISRNYYKGFTVATSFLGDFRGHIMPTGFFKRMSSPSNFATPHVSGTFCRMRWFLRYARGEARLCRRPNPSLLER
jgi:hypothetical protein